MKARNLIVLSGLIVFSSLKFVFACSPVVEVSLRCSAEFLKSFRKNVNQAGRELKELSKKIRKDNQIYLEDVEAALQFGKSNLEYLEDVKIKQTLMNGTPMGLMHRVEAVRSHLTPSEWEKTVSLWGNYLEQVSEIWMTQSGSQRNCTAQEYADEMKTSASTIIVYPVFLGAGAVIEKNPLFLAAAPLGVLPGIVTISADVITFIPNQMKRETQKIHHRFELYQATKAFRRLGEHVFKLESKYKNSHSEDKNEE